MKGDFISWQTPVYRNKTPQIQAMADHWWRGLDPVRQQHFQSTRDMKMPPTAMDIRWAWISIGQYEESTK